MATAFRPDLLAWATGLALSSLQHRVAACPAADYIRLNASMVEVPADVGRYEAVYLPWTRCTTATLNITSYGCLNPNFASAFGLSPTRDFSYADFTAQMRSGQSARSNEDWSNYVQSQSTLVQTVLSVGYLLLFASLLLLVTAGFCHCCRPCRRGDEGQKVTIMKKYLMIGAYSVVACTLLARAQRLGNWGFSHGANLMVSRPPSAFAELAQDFAGPLESKLVPEISAAARSFMLSLNESLSEERVAVAVGVSPERHQVFAHGKISTDGSLAGFLDAVGEAAIRAKVTDVGSASATIFLIAEMQEVFEQLKDMADKLPWRDTAEQTFVGLKLGMDALEDVVDPVSGKRPLEYGPSWYLANIYKVFSNSSKFPDPETFKQNEKPALTGYSERGGTVYTYYPNNEWCLTQECLENYVRHINEDRVTLWGWHWWFSREQVFGFVLFPMLIIFLAAVLALCTGWHQSGLCVICTSMCWLPITFFLLAGFVPLSVVPWDFCSSLAAVGDNSVKEFIPDMCLDYNGGADWCRLRVETLDVTLPQVQPRAIVRTVLSETPPAGETDPLKQFWDELVVAYEPHVRRNVSNFVDGRLEEAGLEDAMLKTQLETQRLVNGVVSAFVDSASASTQVLNGTRLQRLTQDTRASFCCDLVSTLTVYFQSVFLLGLCTLLCACPGGLRISDDWFRKKVTIDQSEFKVPLRTQDG